MIVETITENEDGSANITVDLEPEQAKLLQELGVKLVLYCLAAEKSTEEVFDWLTKEMYLSEYKIDEQVCSDD